MVEEKTSLLAANNFLRVQRASQAVFFVSHGSPILWPVSIHMLPSPPMLGSFEEAQTRVLLCFFCPGTATVARLCGALVHRDVLAVLLSSYLTQEVLRRVLSPSNFWAQPAPGVSKA